MLNLIYALASSAGNAAPISLHSEKARESYSWLRLLDFCSSQYVMLIQERICHGRQESKLANGTHTYFYGLSKSPVASDSLISCITAACNDT